MPHKSKSMTSPSLPRAVILSTGAMPVQLNTIEALNESRVDAFEPTADHRIEENGQYSYGQRGLVKSNSVDIYRLSESPIHLTQSHPHPSSGTMATTYTHRPNQPIQTETQAHHMPLVHTATNAFQSYGSSSHPVSVAFTSSKFYDPRLPPTCDTKGMVYYAAAVIPAHQPTSVAYVTPATARAAPATTAIMPSYPLYNGAPVSAAAAEYGVLGSVAPTCYGVNGITSSDYYVTTSASRPVMY